MSDTRHCTEIRTPCKTVTAGRQKQYWVEFQLVDELGDPLPDLSYRAANDATRAGCTAEYFGHSDGNGMIRIEGLHPLSLTLSLSANPLAQMMQDRRLRAVRPEPARPFRFAPINAYGPQLPGLSPIEATALAAGHGYHYLRIGQLCDEAPVLEPQWDRRDLPKYHFPDGNFSGFTLQFEELNRRNVLEVCPFRAWSLVLNHQKNYCLATAYNLGLMSLLAYSDVAEGQRGSVEDLFLEQCLDMSRTPRILDNGQAWPALVTDVRFDERYTVAVARDTGKAEEPEGDTQFFYVFSASQVIVSWRGTEFKYPFDDVVTDAKYRPVQAPVNRACDEKIDCGELVARGKMHLGFRDAFSLAEKLYSLEFIEFYEEAASKKLFVCGHSLGGALALTHAVSLKHRTPVLYTYGMPRTFTSKAIRSLGELIHFRHVNDTDIVTRVPPEADLDSKLYDVYGPLGTALGNSWSVRKLMLDGLVGHADPYIHHGEIVMFLTAEQHVMRLQPIPDKSLAPRRYISVAAVLPVRAKLYLVPSLSEASDNEAEQAQKDLSASLSPETRAKYFPPNRNVERGGIPDPAHHSMVQYQPFIHNQLLESINPELMTHRVAKRQKFEAQMNANRYFVPPDELIRDRAFLHLQSLMSQALIPTVTTDGGQQALDRFEAIADPIAYYEKL